MCVCGRGEGGIIHTEREREDSDEGEEGKRRS